MLQAILLKVNFFTIIISLVFFLNEEVKALCTRYKIKYLLLEKNRDSGIVFVPWNYMIKMWRGLESV